MFVVFLRRVHISVLWPQNLPKYPLIVYGVIAESLAKLKSKLKSFPLQSITMTNCKHATNKKNYTLNNRRQWFVVGETRETVGAGHRGFGGSAGGGVVSSCR